VACYGLRCVLSESISVSSARGGGFAGEGLLFFSFLFFLVLLGFSRASAKQGLALERVQSGIKYVGYVTYVTLAGDEL